MKNRFASYLKILFCTVCFIPTIVLFLMLLVWLFYKCFATLEYLNIYFFISIIISLLISLRVQGSPGILKKLIALLFISLFISVLFVGGFSETRIVTPDAVIKQNTSNMRSAAEFYYTKNDFSYAGACEDEMVKIFSRRIVDVVGEGKTRCHGPILKLFIEPDFRHSYFSCNDSNDNFIVESYIPSDDSFFCVDSIGFTGSINSSIGDNLKCQ